jgi:hypothetical protein
MIWKLIWDVYKIGKGIKDGIDLLDYEDSTERMLYNRVYKDEIDRIVRRAGGNLLDKVVFIENYKKEIAEDEITFRPMLVSDGVKAQIEYALEERYIGDFGHMRMHALHWAVRKYRDEYERHVKEGTTYAFIYEKYGEMLYEQYNRRYL